VVQEALTNVGRHARARHVWVDLRQRDEEVQVTVRDDGVGFDLADARARALEGDSLGLLGMQERVELLGGKFDIETEPGQGTTLRLWLQVPASDLGNGEEEDREP
jgi:two-component system sensor histidine kinase UhpB